jgi:hypothetical protein
MWRCDGAAGCHQSGNEYQIADFRAMLAQRQTLVGNCVHQSVYNRVNAAQRFGGLHDVAGTGWAAQLALTHLQQAVFSADSCGPRVFDSAVDDPRRLYPCRGEDPEAGFVR